MPWSNQGGGSGGGGGGGDWQGGGRGPWGQGGGGGGGGGQPPNLEELLRKGQDRFKGVLPGGKWGGKGIFLILLVLIVMRGWGLVCNLGGGQRLRQVQLHQLHRAA